MIGVVILAATWLLVRSEVGHPSFTYFSLMPISRDISVVDTNNRIWEGELRVALVSWVAAGAILYIVKR